MKRAGETHTHWLPELGRRWGAVPGFELLSQLLRSRGSCFLSSGAEKTGPARGSPAEEALRCGASAGAHFSAGVWVSSVGVHPEYFPSLCGALPLPGLISAHIPYTP